MNLQNQLSDMLTMSGRVLRHTTRSIDTIITVIIMPVMIMLASVYIFGSAMDLGAVRYVDYITPAILLFAIVSGVAYSAARLNNDVTRGIFERFHSMPIAKSSILGGHVLTSMLFNAITVVAVLLAAFLMGFRPAAGILAWLLAGAMLLLFTLSMTCVALTFGLIAAGPETAGVFSYLILGLLFTSSGFAPTDGMPSGLRAFAQYQPMTPILNSIRSLLTANEISNDFWIGVLWCMGILILFRILVMQVYKTKIR